MNSARRWRCQAMAVNYEVVHTFSVIVNQRDETSTVPIDDHYIFQNTHRCF